MGFVGNYAPHGLSPQIDGMPVIPQKGKTLSALPSLLHGIDYTPKPFCSLTHFFILGLENVEPVEERPPYPVEIRRAERQTAPPHRLCIAQTLRD